MRSVMSLVRSVRWFPASLAIFLGVALPGREVRAQATGPDEPLTCDLSEYVARPDLTARLSGNVLAVEWAGAGDERVSLRLGITNGAPVVEELALLSGAGADWVPVATGAGVEFSIVEGLRRISNQQLAPLRGLAASHPGRSGERAPGGLTRAHGRRNTGAGVPLTV